MIYQVRLKTSAARQLRKLPQPTRDRILDAIEDLADDPRPQGSKKIAGTQATWRIRIGDYRVIYDICNGELLIFVVRVGHRREVYQR